ncbi:MAG: SPOR domain-containing protein [Gammaproteobacteria bacterium]
MEKQTKHRILGIVVIIGLIIILLPFFQSRKELQMDTSAVKAPPFPVQSVPSVTNDTPSTSIPLPNEPEPESDKMSLQPDDTIQTVTPPGDNSQVMPALPETNKVEPDAAPVEKKKITQLDPNGTGDEDEIVSAPESPILKTASAVEKIIVPASIKPIVAEIARPVVHANSLVELKDAAWVVQIGSFKDKANALRLVNQLRASGYRAFVQDMSTVTGGSTRVFVGPENKRNSARIMAIQLEKDLNLHGVVLNYKPLDL